MPKKHLTALSDALVELVASTASFVVAVQGARSNTSGLLWEPDIVVTAEEVLEEDEEITVTPPDGKVVAGHVAGRDPTTDIAVLRLLEPAANAGRPSPAAPVAPGGIAVVVGRAGSEVVTALGIVAQVGGEWRSSTGGLIDARLRFDVWLPSRAEGGALVTADGGLIGMAAFGPGRRVIAIPYATIERVVPMLLETGRIGRGYLGLGLQTVRLGGAGEERSGAMILSVDLDGPGAAAGILQGDIIVAIDGDSLQGVKSLMGHLGPESVGRDARLDVIRGGRQSSITVTVGERPNP
jgi:S1-C subfamily serine protease